LPRLVHSLDLAAEDENSESWRDLLREIDRAFRSFEDMAVRHGWLVGGSATPPPAADTSLPVAKFIAEALADRPIPETWKSDLTGLPGYDCASGDVRLTTDPTCLFDAAGQDMLFPGRAHPLTRRTIAHIRANGIGRVAAARGTLSVLATYTAEGDDHRSRTVFALRLYRDGRIETVDDWLTLATEPAKVDWDLDYAPWADRLTLKQSADAIAQKILCAFTSDEADRFDRQEIACLAWLSRRADDLCGKVRLHTGDLFTDQAASGWRDDPSPERRLRSFAADPHQTAERRAAADGILADFDARPRFVPPVIRLRPLGLLMLHP
jgi:hypothetical protein